MEGSGHDGGRGLRHNGIGLPGLAAQSLGVTASEISAVVMAAVRTWIYYAGWPTELTGTTNPADPGVFSHTLREPLGSEVVENIDVFAPARDDNLHLLRWMR